jgi:RNA polymerase sigma-32 factor
MDREEERLCANEYVKTRAPELAARLISANLRLVVLIARGYRHPERDLRDLIQEGNLGLVQAVARYDPRRGVKLSSYAAWWIRAYILKYTIDNWRLVKTGTTQAQRRLFFRLRGARNKLERSGAPADTRQLAVALDVKESEVTGMLERFASSEASLDAPRISGDSKSGTIGDSLSAASALRPDVQVEAVEFAETLHDKLETFGGTLRDRESDIFRRRLWSEDPATLQQLASHFGVSRERARQLEDRLKGRIRDYLKQELGDAVGSAQATA